MTTIYFREGQTARRAGAHSNQNPYRDNTFAATEWRQGWADVSADLMIAKHYPQLNAS